MATPFARKIIPYDGTSISYNMFEYNTTSKTIITSSNSITITDNLYDGYGRIDVSLSIAPGSTFTVRNSCPYFIGVNLIGGADINAAIPPNTPFTFPSPVTGSVVVLRFLAGGGVAVFNS